MFGKDNSITFQLQYMRAELDAFTKIQDEAAAYNMIDQGDNFDAVRAQLRSGYEVSHLEVSADIFEKLRNIPASKEARLSALFSGLTVKRQADMSAGKMRIALVKTPPRTPNTPNTPDFVAHTDYTPTAHSYIELCKNPCI